MKTWVSTIAGGFAGWDAPYALHPNDEARAATTLNAMIADGIEWPEAEREFRRYLSERGVRGQKLERQMERVAAFISPRLRG
ncbi:MAG: hypothetical protein ACK446_00725 [Rhodobacterales bacterium]|jgi:hypothetical protein